MQKMLAASDRTSSCLSIFAGDRDAKRNIGVLIHGRDSKPARLGKLAEALIEQDIFSAIYLFDEAAYTRDLKETSLSKIDITLNLITGFEGLPASIIESAAEELANDLDSRGWKDVTLIGHSAGGLVARCVLEAFDLGDRIRTVVTLATPHYAWSLQSSPDYWKELPIKDFPYLQIVGEADELRWIEPLAGFRAYDLSGNDDKLTGLTKIVLPDTNHSSIHKKASANCVASLIAEFHKHRGLKRTKPFYVTIDEDDHWVLHYSDTKPRASRLPRPRRLRPSGFSGWLWFQDPHEE